MNQIARIPETTIMTARQIELVKRTIAKDCDAAEFDLYIEVCRMRRLDPFRRHVFPLVFSKDKADKRRMAIVVSRDGQRVIAQRCGNYRPASEPAEYITDEALKSAINPKGIVLCRVRLHQQDKSGTWYPVIGEAYWDEFALVAEEWEWDKEAGKRKPTGRMVLGENWLKMPALMIAKVAEMQALRAGWPEEFGGLYGEEEMDSARALDLSASELVEAEQAERRMVAIGGRDVIFAVFDPNQPMERVPLGQFADRVMAFLERDCDGPADLRLFTDRNRTALQEFWARSKGDALELKKRMEACEQKFIEGSAA